MGISSEIIEKCKKGDRQAFREFYLQSSGWMLGIARRYVYDRNEAMSIVNISLLKALERLKAFDSNREEKIESWLKTILIRSTIDYMRKEKAIISEEFQGETDSHQTVTPASAESNLGKEELLAMVNALNPSTKTVFNLFAIEGFKHSEIADMLNISIGTSKWHLNNARTRLQEMIQKAEK